eukprot:Awhi_evm1s3450
MEFQFQNLLRKMALDTQILQQASITFALDIGDYTNFTAVSLLLGNRNENQSYALDEFHIYVFIALYSVWVYSRMISDLIEQEHEKKKRE